MEDEERLSKLLALRSAVGSVLQNPKGRYFDPAAVLDLFARWSSLRDDLRRAFPSLFGDLPVRDTPVSSGTADNDGRGYIARTPIETLHRDLGYAADLLTRVPASATVSLKVTREGVFFAGQYFDALREVSDLVASAGATLSLIDGYVGSQTLDMLSAKRQGVSVRILTREVAPALRVAAEAFAKQYGSLEIRTSVAFHDRFLIIDDSEFYHFGASLKDLGHRGFMFSRVEEPEVIGALSRKFAEEWQSAKVVL